MPAHQPAYAWTLPMKSHGSIGSSAAVSGVEVVRSTHGEIRRSRRGCGPPRSRSDSARASASPPPDESPASTSVALGGEPGRQRDQGVVGVAPGVLGGQRVVGHHDPHAELVGHPRGVAHLPGADRRHEAATVQVEDGPARSGAATHDRVRREPAGQLLGDDREAMPEASASTRWGGAGPAPRASARPGPARWARRPARPTCAAAGSPAPSAGDGRSASPQASGAEAAATSQHGGGS